ncbi:hypothetical protein B0I37DRAFT_375541 [Chaetomium sp. MPI-CAGE-AT-0009]|nr:hypothetical protein B0I37DRAFT_375541 [Chaetomium sp. MPI-CAGE-AT-0009]
MRVWRVGVWAPVGRFSFVLGYLPARRHVMVRRWLLLGLWCIHTVLLFTVCTIRRGFFHGYGYHEIFGRRWLLGGFYLFLSYLLIAFSFVSESI